MSAHRHPGPSWRPRIALALLSALALAGCGDERGAYKRAVEAYFANDRECFSPSDYIDRKIRTLLPHTPINFSPKGENTTFYALFTKTNERGAKSISQLRPLLDDLHNEKLIDVVSFETEDRPQNIVYIKFTIRLSDAARPYLDTTGQQICSTWSVAEVLSLGETFKHAGEDYRIGRFRIVRTGPVRPADAGGSDLGANPIGSLLFNITALATGADPRGPLAIEVLFRQTREAPQVVRATPGG